MCSVAARCEIISILKTQQNCWFVQYCYFTSSGCCHAAPAFNGKPLSPEPTNSQNSYVCKVREQDALASCARDRDVPGCLGVTAVTGRGCQELGQPHTFSRSVPRGIQPFGCSHRCGDAKQKSRDIQTRAAHLAAGAHKGAAKQVVPTHLERSA